MTRRLLLLLAALLFTVAACGSDAVETADDEDGDITIEEPTEDENSGDADASSNDTGGDDASGDEAQAKQPISEEASVASITQALRSFSAASTLAFGDDEEDCIIETIADEDSSILTADTFEELTLEQQAISLDAAMACAPEAIRAEFLGGFDETDAGPFGDITEEVGDCIYTGLAEDDDDQRLQIQAFLAAGEEIPAPEAAVEPGAALMAECVNFGELLADMMAVDPSMAETGDLIDIDCMSQPGVAEGLFAAILRDPNIDFAGDEIPEGMEPIFACFDFGSLFGDLFGDLLGVELSEEELTCIDGLFEGPDALSSLMSDAGPDDAFMQGVFNCFSPENRAAFGL